MIIYRLLSYTGIVIHATNNFANIDASHKTVIMKADAVRFYFFIAFGVTFFGAVLFLTNVAKSHRWTFYESRQTGPEDYKCFFEASQLFGGSNTKDQQRVGAWVFAHPNYLDKDAVKDWLLKLKSDGEILGRGDKKLPKGCDKFSGHSLESFFTKTLEKFPHFGDAESTAEVEAHIKKLKREVDERPLVEGLKASSRKSIKAEQDEPDDDSADDADSHSSKDISELDSLRLLLKEKDKIIEEKDRVIEEKDAHITSILEEIALLKRSQSNDNE